MRHVKLINWFDRLKPNGETRGTIDVSLQWLSTYLPASTKVRTYPTVCKIVFYVLFEKSLLLELAIWTGNFDVCVTEQRLRQMTSSRNLIQQSVWIHKRFEMINQNFGICCRELGSNLRVFAHASAVSALSVCVGSFSFIISAILPRISWKQIALAARWLSTLSNSMQECRNTAQNNKGTVELIKSSWRESLYSL